MQSEYFTKLLYNKNFNKKPKLIAVPDNCKDGIDTVDSYSHIGKVFYEPDVTEAAFNVIIEYCLRLHDKPHEQLKLDTIFQVLYASQKYMIGPLKNECATCLIKNANSSNIVLFLSEAVKLRWSEMVEKLLAKLSKLIQKNNAETCFELIQSKCFMQLPHDMISRQFIKNDLFNVKEEILFEKCVEYCQLRCYNGNTQERKIEDEKQDVADLEATGDSESINSTNKDKPNWKSMMRSLFLFDIRFPLMDGKYFSEKVNDFKLLTKDEIIEVTFQMINKDYHTRAHEKCKFNNKKRSIDLYTDYQPYDLRMSSKYSGADNTHEALTSQDTSQGAGTNRGQHQWIEAQFSQTIMVTQVDVAAACGMRGDWSVHNCNGRWLQYFDISAGEWVNIKQVTGVKTRSIHNIEVANIETTRIRVTTAEKTDWLGLGHLRIKGMPIAV